MAGGHEKLEILHQADLGSAGDSSMLGDTQIIGPAADTSVQPAGWEAQPSHTQYLEAGQSAFEEAMARESEARESAREAGLDPATVIDTVAPLYRKAQSWFLGAMGSRPVISRKGPYQDPELVDMEPVFWIQYATTLTKQAEASDFEPYQDEASQGHDRRDDYNRIAVETLQMAGELMLKDRSKPDDEILARAAVVVAEGLETHGEHEASTDVLGNAKDVLTAHNTNPKLAKFIRDYEEHTTNHGQDKEFTRQVVAAALLDITTGSRDAVAMY